MGFQTKGEPNTPRPPEPPIQHRKSARQIREEIGISFAKGFSEANYDNERYLNKKIDNLTYENEYLKEENYQLTDKLAEIRDNLFDESDMEAEGHGMEDMIGSPYAVLCYVENKLKRLIEENKQLKQEWKCIL